MARRANATPADENGITGRVSNHVEVDWPRSLGFFGALGAAAALDLVPIPIAVFVASVPFLKLLNRPHARKAQRFVGHLVDGAAKPVGGDSEGTVRWAAGSSRSPVRRSGARRTPRAIRRTPRARRR